MALKFPKALVDAVASRPKVKTVFLNKDGGWLFNKHDDYPTEVPRKDILDEKNLATDPESEKDPVETKKTAKK